MLNLIQRFPIDIPSDAKQGSDLLPDGLREFANTSPTLARIYAGRGITAMDELDTKLAGLLPASDLLGIDDAVTILDTALDTGKRILIVGDFDCDGATSTALMVRVLTAMGASTGAAIYYIVPDRFKYGYGLTPEIVELGIKKYQPELIVTVDNGISSHDGVAKAHEHGIDVIITDHHLTTKPKPPAQAVVNPNQLDCEFTSKSLVGVGVAFYVLGRLAKQRRQNDKSSYQVSKHLDLVALGTIADIGVLDKNNRILVHQGLQAIRKGNCCVGILSLLDQAGKDYKRVTAQDFGFIIAPRINAAGRMDSMDVGIECLVTDDLGRAQDFAHQLDNLNKERRSVEGKMRDEADEIINALMVSEANQADDDETAMPADAKPVSDDDKLKMRSVILYQEDWHQGVIGIVAGRLKETYYRPAIVFAPADVNKVGNDDLIKGSARSINGIHVRDVIEHVAENNPNLISHFGGHAMAAGLTLKRGNFTDFYNAFNAVMSEVEESIFTEEKYTDGQLLGQDFSLLFVDTLKNASIWGHGFVAPTFDGIFTVVNFRVLKDKHLKLTLNYPNVQYPIEAICFNFNNDAWDYRASKVHLLFELDINEWQGRQNIQLMVKDFSVVEVN